MAEGWLARHWEPVMSEPGYASAAQGNGLCGPFWRPSRSPQPGADRCPGDAASGAWAAAAAQFLAALEHLREKHGHSPEHLREKQYCDEDQEGSQEAAGAAASLRPGWPER
jgi:hypothetical protein